MSLLSGADLRDAITRVLHGKIVFCAVAFWGKGAEDIIGMRQNHEIKLICNLRMGGTDPNVIEKLIKSGATVQQNDRLHAKVYIGDKQAIVASANASINGLGLEGDELAGWIETGVQVPAEDALPWFNEIWNQSRPILPRDIEEARRLFRERAVVKPTRGSFAEFHPTKEDFPLISWVGTANYKYNDADIKRSLGRVDDSVYGQIDEGLDIDVPEDVALFRRGLWVLYWSVRADGTPGQRPTIWWTCSSGIHVPNAFTYDNEQPQGAILAMDPMPPEPFSTSERRFRNAFKEVMPLPKFNALRDLEYSGTFYTDVRLKLMWQFWVELKRRYNEL